MVDRLNPAETTAAESDYQKKFTQQTRKATADSTKKLKEQEAAGDSTWKTATGKNSTEQTKQRRFRFAGKKAGKLQQGSTFLFLFGLIIAGVWYTSMLAPNILLVNIKEMYTNDLADSTTALEVYTQIMYFNKIGPMSGQDCIDGQPMDQQPIKCKLTTMSRSQKQAFEKQGFIFGFGNINVGGAKVNGDIAAKKVYEDNLDDGDASNDLPESRYKIYAIIPPNYKQVVDSVTASGLSSFSDIISGNGNPTQAVEDIINQLMNPLKDTSQNPQQLLEGILAQAPITSGPQLWLYSQLSTTTRMQVYSVFHPKASFFQDARFSERLKTRYNMTKQPTVSGDTEQKVDRSFDNSVQKADGAIDMLTGQPNPTDGVSLASLSTPLNLTQLQSLANNFKSGISLDTVGTLTNQLPAIADIQSAGNLLATYTFSYTDLMCSWYTIGKMSQNALTRAKATTAARYALQYLKAADAIKAGTSDEVPTNALASKLAQNTLGGYGGGSATDSLIYRSVTYGDILPGSPSELGNVANLIADAASIVTYNLSAYENIGTLAASWAQVIPNAAALGAVVGASGMLAPPSVNVGGADREYCLSGETTDNKTTTKGESTQTTKCLAAVEAMTPLGIQAATAPAAELGRRTCPPTNASDDNLIRLLLGDWRGPVHNTMLPSQKATQVTMTPYIASWFGINTMVAAAATQQLYTSQIKGIAANYALFSGTGELLGDMAMSRGLVPSNMADMELYLNLGEVIGAQTGLDEIEKYQAKQNPFDPYNKFSFVGSLARSLPIATDEQTPLFASLSNILSFIGSSATTITTGQSASAFYHIQPSLLTSNDMLERQGGYLARLSGAFCPLDVEYLSIGIQADIMCNVRYSMPLDDIPTALNLSGVIDYMTKSNPSVYDSKSQELNERVAKADLEGNNGYLAAQKTALETIKNQPFIDKNTGKPTAGGEYEKYLQYCVNRLDPWGRSAIYMRYEGLPEDQVELRKSVTDKDGQLISQNSKGDPNQKFATNLPMMAVNATQSDLDWYTGKKCTRMTDQSEMLKYFRVYTMMCSVDGSMSGITDCTERDNTGSNYADPFYLTNDILYTSWN